MKFEIKTIDILLIHCLIRMCVIWRQYMVMVVVTPFSTIFPLYCGGQFYWWRKPGKTTDCRKSLTHFITYCWIDYTSPCISGGLCYLIRHIRIPRVSRHTCKYITTSEIWTKKSEESVLFEDDVWICIGNLVQISLVVMYLHVCLDTRGIRICLIRQQRPPLILARFIGFRWKKILVKH
jgi:hypothetical protein